MDRPIPDFSGLTTTEAQKRLEQFGPNEIRRQTRTAAAALLLTQFKSPIVLILIGAAAVSLFLQANTEVARIHTDCRLTHQKTCARADGVKEKSEQGLPLSGNYFRGLIRMSQHPADSGNRRNQGNSAEQNWFRQSKGWKC